VNYLVDNWSFDPFVVVVAVIVIVNELGIANLRRRSIPERSRRRRIRSLFFYGGLALLLIAYVTHRPLGGRLLRAHDRAHPIASSLIPDRGGWLPLLHGLPVGLRRRLIRSVLLGRFPNR
jgi:hypothetical protein